MNTTTNTSRPATAAEAVAILLPEDDGMPTTREGLEALIRELGHAASEIEDQMRRPAKVLTGPATSRAIRRALEVLAGLGEQYEGLRSRERVAVLKLRVVEQVERLYAAE